MPSVPTPQFSTCRPSVYLEKFRQNNAAVATEQILLSRLFPCTSRRSLTARQCCLTFAFFFFLIQSFCLCSSVTSPNKASIRASNEPPPSFVSQWNFHLTEHRFHGRQGSNDRLINDLFPKKRNSMQRCAANNSFNSLNGISPEQTRIERGERGRRAKLGNIPNGCFSSSHLPPLIWVTGKACWVAVSSPILAAL